MKHPAIFLVALLVTSLLNQTVFAAEADRAMVATVNPTASEAGLQAIRDGGNAVDAAIAAALTLGVVDSHNSGIGGGCFILIRTPQGQTFAIDGREIAPSAAHRDMFVEDGKALPERSQLGPLAAGVPGALAAYEKAIGQHGKLSLKKLLLPAADIAKRGFMVDRVLAERIAQKREQLLLFEGTREVLLKPDGSAYIEGEIIRQPDLARTYSMVAEHGIDWFYKGEFARRVGDWMAANGGVLTASDFASYSPKDREPIKSTYRDLEVVGFPPPSSGGVHVAQMLNMLEQYDLPKMKQGNGSEFYHVVAEAMKLAFADRAHWLGDADFAKVPKGLVEKSYASELAKKISMTEAGAVQKHGMPAEWDKRFFNRHTTHIAAVDSEGYWVGITATINTTFGSKVIVPGTGVVLNNEMDDFAARPGAPNAFGLIGAENNSIHPGKRPLSSMSPTIVLKDGKPILTCGAAGGPKIITQVLLTIVNHLDLGMPLDRAVGESRFHHQWFPDSLMVESTFPFAARDDLAKLGHSITVLETGGVTQAIARDGDKFIGVNDPRIPGRAAGLSSDR